jgi:hypothetical protein
MIYFIQVKWYDMNMHAKIQCMNMHGFFFVNNYFNLRFMEILYKTIMHKNGFCQAYFKYLLEMILRKFISYLSELYSNFHAF